MKFWHVGLVVAGAAVAGGVAVRLAEPPAVPAAAPSAPSPQPAPQVSPSPAPAPPVPWKAAPPPEPAEAISSAPPPVYTEPPAPPAPVKKPRPFQTPLTVAKALPAPAIKAPPPVPYQEPPKPARHAVLEEGTRITVRVSPEDVSRGVLEQPVIADGLEIAERGAKVTLRAEQGNQLRVLSFQSADGQRVEVSAEPAAPAGNIVRFRLSARVIVTERKL